MSARIPIFISLAALAAVVLAGNALTGGETMESKYKASDGWQPLFNGTDLSEFVIEDGTATYTVRNGVITGTTAIPSPNTFLATRKTYGDFELVFETKVDGPLNSGVQIRSRSREDTGAGKGRNFQKGRFFGPQVEIEASPGQAGYIYGEAMGTGWLSPEPDSDDPAVNQTSLFHNGEWNHFRIVARGPRIQTFVNGRPVADLTDEAAYCNLPEGHIGLQVHSIKPELHPLSVSWRNLFIKPISQDHE